MSNTQKPATAQSTNQPSSSTEADNQFDISESSYKTGHAAVRKARRFAMQGLYEWLMTDRRFEQEGQREWKANPPHDIAARTRANNAMHTVHLGYYHQMMRDIPEQIDELDTLISQHLDRDINLLDPIEHAILLIGTYELKDHLEVPYKVVLDEAMKLNTHFGATDAHKLINAVLDKLAPQLREVEVAAAAEQPKTATKAKVEPIQAEQIQQTEENTNSFDTQEIIATETTVTDNIDNEAEVLPKAEPKPRIGLKAGQPNRKRAVTAQDTTDKENKEPVNTTAENISTDTASNND
ncbi:transcription antitermination factor NusB [Psychrobacter sp. I-STPA10]|uniref:transcription antitermination factor NusB n=1 Tax=Psychrobacter sp. I-STPA10 TaxID=2585769 RepID=UPI001E60F8BD|nr:transcription antitermination factor NusB [Psychrobacter sp. I-STPA10]